MRACCWRLSGNYRDRGSSADCAPSVFRHVVQATVLINRVMVYRPGNCVCHRHRGIKARSDVPPRRARRGKITTPVIRYNSRNVTPREITFL